MLEANHQPSNIQKLVALLQDPKRAPVAVNILLETVCLFDAYYQVVAYYRNGNPWALQLLKGWAEKSWLYNTQALPESIDGIVLKVDGAVTAAMLSPINAAFTRSDIALHAQSLLAEHMPETLFLIEQLKTLNCPIIFVAEQIDTTHASLPHRQSAVQALLWHIGVRDALSVTRGVILSERIDPYFYDIAENLGTLVLKMPVHSLHTGDKLRIKPYQGIVVPSNAESIPFTTDQSHWQSIWRMGSRTQFMLGEALTRKAKACLHESQHSQVITAEVLKEDVRAYTLAQKMIGKACGLPGVIPETVYEVMVDTVAIHSATFNGRQEDVPPGYFTDLVVKGGKETPNSQAEFIMQPREGRLQAWLSRLLIPDAINLSGDADVRYPLGLTLSGSTAEMHQASRTALISVRVPESVLVRFSGEKPPHIRLRDIINAISYAITNKYPTSASNHPIVGRIAEIQGLDFLTVEEAYELTEDSVSYQSAACVVALSERNVLRALHQNRDWLSQFIRDKHPYYPALQRRLNRLNHWIDHPQLLKVDEHANYTQTIHIALENLKEPLLASIEDSAVLSLSKAAESLVAIDAVWIGSSATHLDHYRVVAKLLQKHPHRLKSKLWIAPPSTIELKQLIQEGCYQVYGRRGVYTQMPANAFCTDAYFQPGSTVLATSSRVLLNKTRRNWRGYITSPELATITALLGRLPKLYEYQSMLINE